jgi:hypothetical protein
MKMTTTLAAVAMCASLYLTPGPAQALVSLNGLYPNGAPFNGLNPNRITTNGIYVNGTSYNALTSNRVLVNGTALNDGPTPAVQRESLPFNGLSQKGLGKTHP